MRPSPLILLLVVLGGLGLAAVPLTHLTRPVGGVGPAPEAPATDSSKATHTTTLRLRLAHTPEVLELSHGEETLLRVPADGTATLLEAQVPLTLPPEGVEFRLAITWPEGTPQTAVTLEVEPEGLDAQSATYWTDTGTLTEIIPFTWP